jgi:hypothetical protein
MHTLSLAIAPTIETCKAPLLDYILLTSASVLGSDSSFDFLRENKAVNRAFAWQWARGTPI